MIAGLAAELQRAGSILVVSHQDPDGDALGSTLGLTHLLQGQGKKVFPHLAGRVAEEYAFLPGREWLRSDLPAAKEVDLAVMLDCHQTQRTGSRAAALLPQVARVLVIDHHLGESAAGPLAWVDPGFAATSEMLFLLAREAGWDFTPAAAQCLFTGLQTDTGRFSYSNTTARALRVAADLVELGADPWASTQEVYSSSPNRLLLLGRVFASLSLRAGGRLALALARQRDLEELACPPSDLDRVVEELRYLRGVEVSVLLKEQQQGMVKASLRSRGGLDVGSLAVSLGGGGHKNAAGVTLPGSLEQARAQLVEILTPRLEALA